MSWQDSETIWLQPWCDKCQNEFLNSAIPRIAGRRWCKIKIWDHCDMCERRPVKYKMVKRSVSPADKT